MQRILTIMDQSGTQRILDISDLAVEEQFLVV